MRTRSIVGLTALTILAAAVGVFAGLAAWNAFSEHRANRAKATEEQAAADLAKTPIGRQREAVKRFVNDPTSVTFRNERASNNKPQFWCGELNAKNRMGAFVGFTRYVVELHEPGSQYDDVVVDPSDKSSTDYTRFAAYWSGYCEQ